MHRKTPEPEFFWHLKHRKVLGARKSQEFGAPEAPERSGASGGARIYSKFAPEISGAPAPSSHKLTAGQAACEPLTYIYSFL